MTGLGVTLEGLGGCRGGKVTEESSGEPIDEMTLVGGSVRLHTALAVVTEDVQCPLQFSALQHGALIYTLHCLCPD